MIKSLFSIEETHHSEYGMTATAAVIHVRLTKVSVFCKRQLQRINRKQLCYQFQFVRCTIFLQLCSKLW